MTRSSLGEHVTLAELEGDPHELIARLRAAEPVSWLPVLDGWLVTRRAQALEVMRDAATFTVDDPRFSTAQVVGPSMLSLDGAEHARHREPFARAFRPAEVRARFTELIEEEGDRLITALGPGTAELRRDFAGPFAVAVIARALGLRDVAPGTVLSWYDAIVGAVSSVTAGDGVTAGGAAAFQRLRSAVEDSLGPPAGSPAMPSALAEAAGRLTTAEVVSNAAVLMFGGIETVEGMIVNAVWHLLGHPDQLALVLADPGLVANAVEESMRLEPAAAVVDRYATRDVRLGGAAIRRGDLVRVSLTGANRDPELFSDPDRFDVRRENARLQLVFAHGPHYCLGVHLARLEARIAVGTLLRRLPGLRLDPAQPSAPRGLVFRKPPALRVAWDG
ncbi:cytochrome P450 [Actinomadura scrupuli]|uniref:cytochrome P450 n=1 Tax=Actinomadura scrupuli TaxID=559629 RepID=UPI003D95F920